MGAIIASRFSFDGACYRSFMVRPRWHDIVIVTAIVGVALAGAWALWWDDVRSAVHTKPAVTGAPGSASTTPTTPAL